MESSPSYAHKKFSAQKRKRSQDSEQDDDVVFVMEQPATQLPAAKRRQPSSFFRPWLDQPQAKVERLTPPMQTNNILPAHTLQQYHANMVRARQPARQRSPKEQQRRDRNTLASLRNRRAQQAQHETTEQQYIEYRQKHEAILEQQLRFSLYYVRYLQAVLVTPQLNLGQQQWLPQLASSQQILYTMPR